MKWTVEFRDEALDDIRKIRVYLARKSSTLQAAFAWRLRESSAKLEINPLAYAKTHRKVRICKLKKFRYQVFFEILHGDRVEIFAVLHSSRSAKNWLKRI